MAGFINWEAILELTMPDMSARPAGMDDFAVQYDGMTKLEKEHTGNQIEVMKLEPTDTVLDVGAGPGRISIPVAKKVKSVTALDGSPKMLEACKKNAEEEGIENITYLNLPWDDAVAGKTIDKHDVVIASRSPGMRTPEKLNDMARKYVYILTFVGPRLKAVYDELVEGIDETSNPPVRNLGIEHQWVIFNRICELGIYPSVQYVKDGFTRWYENREAAYDDLRWLIDIPPDKEDRYRQNIDRILFPENGGFRLLRETETVIIWWKKED